MVFVRLFLFGLLTILVVTLIMLCGLYSTRFAEKDMSLNVEMRLRRIRLLEDNSRSLKADLYLSHILGKIKGQPVRMMENRRDLS